MTVKRPAAWNQITDGQGKIGESQDSAFAGRTGMDPFEPGTVYERGTESWPCSVRRTGVACPCVSPKISFGLQLATDGQQTGGGSRPVVGSDRARLFYICHSHAPLTLFYGNRQIEVHALQINIQLYRTEMFGGHDKHALPANYLAANSFWPFKRLIVAMSFQGKDTLAVFATRPYKRLKRTASSYCFSHVFTMTPRNSGVGIAYPERDDEPRPKSYRFDSAGPKRHRNDSR